MKYGITNAKGGGGSLTIPIITILATQQNTDVLPDINYLLTQEQIDAFNDNNVVEVILPDGTDYLYQANITSDTTQWDIKVFSKVVVGTDATGDFASSKNLVFITDNITINEITMRGGGGGKQLYLHNITITNNNNSNYVIRIHITNDSIEAFNYSSLRQWLNAKGFNAVATNPQYYQAIGNYSVYSELCDVVGVADNDGNPNALWLQGVKKDGSAIQTGQLGSNYKFNDVVILL